MEELQLTSILCAEISRDTLRLENVLLEAHSSPTLAVFVDAILIQFNTPIGPPSLTCENCQRRKRFVAIES